MEIELDRWRRLQELFEAAADLEPGKQAAYLASACAGDDGLRHEVEALLHSDAEAGSFIEQAIWRGSDQLLAAEPDPLAALGKIGKYEILGRIGEGGFGVVYKGRDPVLQRWVAVKTCSSSDEKLRRRFFREGQIAAGLQHPNITTVHDLGVERGIPYLVQEFLGGEDLHHKIARAEGLTVLRRLDVLAQVARGLEYAHQQGVLHRDVKPANIRILPSGTVKIMDFGIAKLLHEVSDVTTQGLTLGTVGYLAPEQLRGEEVDRRTDVFSFGVLVYELLTYERPFRGRTFSEVSYRLLNEEPAALRDLAPTCSRAIAELASRCLAKDPRQRYDGFDQVLAVLEPEIEALRSGAFQLAPGAGAAAAGAAVVAGGLEAASGEAVGGGEPAGATAMTARAERVAAASSGADGAGTAGGAAAGSGVDRAGTAAGAAALPGIAAATAEGRAGATGRADPNAAAAPGGTAGRRRWQLAVAGWLAAAAVALAAAAGLGGRMASRHPVSDAVRAAAVPALPPLRGAPATAMPPEPPGPASSPRAAAPAPEAASPIAATGAAAPVRQSQQATAGSSATAPQAAAGEGSAAGQLAAGRGLTASQDRRVPQGAGGRPGGRSTAGGPPAGTAGAGSNGAVAPRGEAENLTGTLEGGSRGAQSTTGLPPGLASGSGAPDDGGAQGGETGGEAWRAAAGSRAAGEGAGEPGGAARPMARGELIAPGAPGATPPRLLSRPEPQYPERARRRQVEADVLLLALVDENGRVVRTIVKRTDDPGLGFNEAAKKAALRTTFDPATRDGLPGKMWTELPFSFRLHPGE
jgi:TonB family protein